MLTHKNRKLIAVRGNSSLNILPVLRPLMSTPMLHACTGGIAFCKAFNIAAALAYRKVFPCCGAAMTHAVVVRQAAL
jgi:hypothetical protein